MLSGVCAVIWWGCDTSIDISITVSDSIEERHIAKILQMRTCLDEINPINPNSGICSFNICRAGLNLQMNGRCCCCAKAIPQNDDS
jgi:hypothetical protein